jgi:hypothetical protein
MRMLAPGLKSWQTTKTAAAGPAISPPEIFRRAGGALRADVAAEHLGSGRDQSRDSAALDVGRRLV